MILRWSEDNCHIQCNACNLELQGNLEVYREKLIDLYGLEKVEKMEQMRFQEANFSKSELLELFKKYKNLITI